MYIYMNCVTMLSCPLTINNMVLRVELIDSSQRVETIKQRAVCEDINSINLIIVTLTLITAQFCLKVLQRGILQKQAVYNYINTSIQIQVIVSETQ